MSEQIKNQVNEEKDTQADRASSPLPAQVEGQLTARGWKWIHASLLNPEGVAILTVSGGIKAAHAALILTAVNEYDSSKAKVEKLETALITAFSDGVDAAKQIIRDEPLDELEYVKPLLINAIARKIDPRRAALIDSPRKEN